MLTHADLLCARPGNKPGLNSWSNSYPDRSHHHPVATHRTIQRTCPRERSHPVSALSALMGCDRREGCQDSLTMPLSLLTAFRARLLEERCTRSTTRRTRDHCEFCSHCAGCSLTRLHASVTSLSTAASLKPQPTVLGTYIQLQCLLLLTQPALIHQLVAGQVSWSTSTGCTTGLST